MEAIYAIIATVVLIYVFWRKPTPIEIEELDPREIIYSEDEDTLLVPTNIFKPKEQYFDKDT
jgi:hypothetical protein